MGRINAAVIEDAARTALAAVASFLAARALGMPEAYWATISTIIVMQSTLGAALPVSWQRFAGTVLGATSGAVLSTFFGVNLAAFGLGIFALGLICEVVHLRTAFRFAGVTLTITMLIVRNGSPWIVAEHRFIEVSAGILIALAVSAIWPMRDSKQVG